MRFLVSAGNTQTPIDRVRCLTNIFSGRTGGRIAMTAHARGHAVTLLTSHPEALNFPASSPTWKLAPYKTFDDLQSLLQQEIQTGGYDIIVHAAAVSDFISAGVYAPAPGTQFDPVSKTWLADDDLPHLVDVSAGKVKSKHGEIWLRLTPAAQAHRSDAYGLGISRRAGQVQAGSGNCRHSTTRGCRTLATGIARELDGSQHVGKHERLGICGAGGRRL